MGRIGGRYKLEMLEGEGEQRGHAVMRNFCAFILIYYKTY
jgi:hypothetical protein